MQKDTNMTEFPEARCPTKAPANDFPGRFREIIADPINLLIERVPLAGTIDETGMVILHNGNRVALNDEYGYYGSFSQILILNRGVHEPLEEYVFQQVLQRVGDQPLMLELGAYWAHYSMWLHRARHKATTIMVEPDEKNLKVGQKNFSFNHFSGEFLPAAVGTGQFSVDDFVNQRALRKLDILHADIQGAEVEMLTDCRRCLADRRIDYIFVSTHSQSLHHDVLALLKGAGYRVEISSDHEYETTSHDGLVFASNPDLPPIFETFTPLGRQEICYAKPANIITSLLVQLGSPS